MKLFQRRKENFACGHCGYKVIGNGYTDHCPKCLYSKHVDIHPGDRKQICQGLMRPIGVVQVHGEYIILYKCLNCNLVRRNKAAAEDDLEQIIIFS